MMTKNSEGISFCLVRFIFVCLGVSECQQIRNVESFACRRKSEVKKSKGKKRFH